MTSCSELVSFVNEEDQRYLADAACRIEKLLISRTAMPLRPEGLSPDLQAFAEKFDHLLEAMEALRRFAIALGNGDLSHEPPKRLHLLDSLKQLQSNLRHLTWQTLEVAAGNFDQQVDFLGEFSAAFNKMVEGLREKRTAEEQMRYLSLHDALTGLYNRAFFNEEIERLRLSSDYPVSFLIADLDDLKPVNDTYGHQVGDLLIQTAARLLEHGVRGEDSVVRVGGDEFTIILYGTDYTTANAVLDRIRTALNAYNRRNESLSIHMSLGTATAQDDADLEDALRRADEAMYQDKVQRKEKLRNG